MPVSWSSYSNYPVADSAFHDVPHKTQSDSADYFFSSSKVAFAPESSFQYQDSTFDFFNDDPAIHQDCALHFADADSSAPEWNLRGGDLDSLPANHRLQPPVDLYNYRAVHARASSHSTIESRNSDVPQDKNTSTSPTSSDDDSFQFSSPASYLRRITLTSAQGDLMDRSYSRRSLDYNNNEPNSVKPSASTMSAAGSTPTLPGPSPSLSSNSAHSNGRDTSSSTSRTNNGEDNEDKPDQNFPTRPVPKFDRTISDIYADELYNPAVSPAGTPAPKQPLKPSGLSVETPFRSVITDRLQQANEARATSPSNDIQRDPSPFRQGSPFASTGQFAPHRGRLNPPSGLSVGARGQLLQPASTQRRPALRSNESQPTISPKDAELVYHEPDDQARPPSLFPEVSYPYPAQGPSNGGAPLSYGPLGDTRGPSADSSSRFPMPGSNFNTFVMPTVPASEMQASNDIKSGFGRYRPTSSAGESSPELPVRLISMETSTSGGDAISPDEMSPNEDEDVEYESGDEEIERPNGTTADTGTYTCTYSGCTRRFETPAQLQKHKRDGHRIVAPTSVTSGSNSPSTTPTTDSGMTSAAALRNSQAGPHRCDRINPQTGKSCNTVFSRPYDLTRHEDTIHNMGKKKVRCQYCEEEKTFSRSDALTRHMRVVHPDVDYPQKAKKRD